MFGKVMIGGLVALVVAVLGWMAYPHVETARIWYRVTGVDVSHHQGRIDWPRVADSGVQFAYLKATEGGDFVDGRFRDNWQAAKAAGLAVGGYHFFRQCKDGREQAANFLKTLPPVLDAEDIGPCPPGSARLDPVAEIGAFLDAVEAAAWCRPVLYVTPQFDNAWLDSEFAAETFWLRSIFLPPTFREDRWAFWQYHHDGRRAGIDGAVDLDAFRGSPEDLQSLIRTSGCFVRDG